MRRMLNIGIIPDGNRTWARQNKKSPRDAYDIGMSVAMKIIESAAESGNMKWIVFYALSQDNLQKRSSKMLALIIAAIEKFLAKANNSSKFRVRCYGDSSHPKIARLLRPSQQDVNSDARLQVALLINYSPAWDFSQRPICTNFIPPLDLIIRTSGKMRLSGFLPCQSANASFFFPATLWPDFTAKKFKNIVGSFSESTEDYSIGS